MEEMLWEHGSNILAVLMGIVFLNIAFEVVDILMNMQWMELDSLI